MIEHSSTLISELFQNNEAPEGGSCSLSPTTVKTLSKVTVSMPGWSDVDGVVSYSVYRTSSSSEFLEIIAPTARAWNRNFFAKSI